MKRVIRHGDVGIHPIQTTNLKEIPKDAVQQKDLVVAHGESGHRHIIKNGQILLLQKPMQVRTESGTKQVEKFLHIPKDTTISHEEHLTLEIPKGDYIVLQEREMDHMAEVERSVLD